MHKYYCLNPIAEVGLKNFDQNFEKTDEVEEADAILVRSAGMTDMTFSDHLEAIARAGAGVNNIPLDRCAEQGIVVFNTPGANANGVKELVIAGMLLSARDIVGGINWVRDNQDDKDLAKTTEKQKKAYAGTELKGKKLGVIGLGAIGVQVANAALSLGMDVYGYDPYLSVESAWNLSRNIHHEESTDELYKECDYITIHVPAMDSTKGMIDQEAISLMKKDVVILNFARDVLVDTEAIVDALQTGKIRKYVTDFPIPEIVGLDNAIVIPHLGASTEESEDNCAVMAVREIQDYIENGNIVNSVNYPDCQAGIKEKETSRICINHRNIPNILGTITSTLAENGFNISLMENKSKQEFAYTVIDVDGEISAELEEKIAEVKDVIRVRVIK